MDNWRKKGDKYNQEIARTKSNNHYRKPPVGGNPNWQQNLLPSWEKRFVTSVGSLSWKKFLEAKEFTHLYDNILKWDDSAGKEAFRNAKDRFHAQIHNIPCNIELPKPDLYIDNIDWNSWINEDLILDLESDYTADANCEHEPVLIFGDAVPNPYEHYSPYGWGDSDDKMKNAVNDASQDNNGINWDYVNKWDNWGDVGPANHWWAWNENDKNAGQDQGWNDDKNVYQGFNAYENDNSYSHVNMSNDNSYSHVNKGNESYKTWRNHGDNNQRNRSWRNNGYRRKSNGQGYGNQRMQVSTVQGYGNQRIHVQP